VLLPFQVGCFGKLSFIKNITAFVQAKESKKTEVLFSQQIILNHGFSMPYSGVCDEKRI